MRSTRPVPVRRSLVASPLLGLAALAVKLEDGGPVLYRQRRVGKDGVEFELLKLRTMVVGAESLGAGYAVDRGDSRITRVGRVLRRLSIDELPQLWNVVRGEMSLIGPRPTLRYQVDRYTERQRRRLEVRPGLTGWAQIHGRAELPWDERIELDVWYVEHRSPWVDLKILARTPLALFSGTYKGATGGWSRRGYAGRRSARLSDVDAPGAVEDGLERSRPSARRYGAGGRARSRASGSRRAPPPGARRRGAARSGTRPRRAVRGCARSSSPAPRRTSGSAPSTSTLSTSAATSGSRSSSRAAVTSTTAVRLRGEAGAGAVVRVEREVEPCRAQTEAANGRTVTFARPWRQTFARSSSSAQGCGSTA